MTGDLVPVPGTGWALWRQAALRTAGFPAALVQALADPEVHAAAVGDADAYPAAFAEAEQRRSAAARVIAAMPLLREAIAWQNPSALELCVDKIAEGAKATPSVRRKRELKLASYVQRYAVKNDTIGFFGPVGLAWWADHGPAVRVEHGLGLTTARNVHFEHWAVDALAAAVAALPGIAPWLTPLRSPADTVDGSVVIRPSGPAVPLDDDALRLLLLCDGHTPVRRMTDEIGAAVTDRLPWLLDQGLVETGFTPPHGPAPERWLRERVLAVGDPAARESALALIEGVLAARDTVAAAAGDADKLLTALSELGTRFTEATGAVPRRRPGQPYAGRGVVFEDTLRDMTVDLGPDLLARLAGPLGLLLDSARWFVAEAGAAYRRRFAATFAVMTAKAGTDVVPFHRFFSAVVPDLVAFRGELPTPLRPTVAALQDRWADLLAVPDGVREHRVRSADLAARARELFPPSPPPWSSAVHHCPDIMIAAPDPAAIAAGECVFVLGEMHVAMNTLDSRVTAAQHPDPGRLLAQDVADRLTPRVLPVPAKESPTVNSRTYPPVFVQPDQVFWTAHAENTGAPGPVIAATAMTVERDGDRLVVVAGDQRLDLMEVLGEHLSAAVLNAFSPVRSSGHRPRVSVDDLVVARESWRFPADELTWALVPDRVERYRQAVAWQRASCLPARAFYRVLVENKPLYVDFTSPVLVDLLAMSVKHSLDDDPDAPVSISEMTPDLGEQWLHDACGARYSAELRVVAVDRAVSETDDRGQR